MKTHANKKEIQRELTSLKNKHVGPKWNQALEDYKKYVQLNAQCESLQKRITEYEDHESIVKDHVITLYELGYINSNDPYKQSHGRDGRRPGRRPSLGSACRTKDPGTPSLCSRASLPS